MRCHLRKPSTSQYYKLLPPHRHTKPSPSLHGTLLPGVPHLLQRKWACVRYELENMARLNPFGNRRVVCGVWWGMFFVVVIGFLELVARARDATVPCAAHAGCSG